MENTSKEKDSVILTSEQKFDILLQSHTALQEKVSVLENMLNAKTEISSKKVELPTIPKDAIEFNGKKYEWKVAIFHSPIDAKKTTAEEASLDEEILTAILAIKGQGMLVEVK